MSQEKTNNKENTNSSIPFGFETMDQMMARMRSICCTDEAGFPDCMTMMKQMRNQSGSKSQETNNKSGEMKK
ncbi:MAG: hypothetical protein ACM339_15110 [Ignavibacteria bacterium]